MVFPCFGFVAVVPVNPETQAVPIPPRNFARRCKETDGSHSAPACRSAMQRPDWSGTATAGDLFRCERGETTPPRGEA